MLLGPSNMWGWLVLRALLYWGFLSFWWLALGSMPIGDATSIVYTSPVWTAVFAALFLGEHIDWVFLPIIMLDAVGICLLTQPAFIMPAGVDARVSHGEGYYLGVAASL